MSVQASIAALVVGMTLIVTPLAVQAAEPCNCEAKNFGLMEYDSGGRYLQCSLVCTGTAKDKEGNPLGVFEGPDQNRETYTGGDVAGMIGKVINSIVVFLGVIFLVLAIWSGGSLMFAGGDTEKVSAARDTLSAAVIGVIITVSAYVIMNFVLNELLARALS